MRNFLAAARNESGGPRDSLPRDVLLLVVVALVIEIMTPLTSSVYNWTAVPKR